MKKPLAFILALVVTLSTVCFAASPDAKSTLTITKQDVLVVTARILGLSPTDGDTTFEDDADISSWAKPYINALQKNGYIDGDFHNNIIPNKEMSLDDILTLIKGTVDKAKASATPVATATPAPTHKVGGGSSSKSSSQSSATPTPAPTEAPKDTDNIGDDIF